MIGKLKALVFGLLFIPLLNPGYTQIDLELVQADSLFISQKYTEAFDIYHQVFLTEKVTESMLVKMAFIKEGLGDDVQALYYLDQYYSLTADKSILLKMEELANANRLNGYKVEDKDFFMNLTSLYGWQIQVTLISICVFLLFFSFRSKKKKRLPIGVPALQVILLAVVLVLSNNWLQSDTGIIQSPTLLMSGPSAGSEPVGWVNEGHKINVLDKFDVWTKISWESGHAYIRNSKLLTSNK